ncbi:hypothetical protein A2U01_0118280, partial [Trifolium medium]|nr:hypothetical protein [Trifolium medium]
LRSDPKAIGPGCGSNTAFEAALQ